jgi:hypothetical protein
MYDMLADCNKQQHPEWHKKINSQISSLHSSYRVSGLTLYSHVVSIRIFENIRPASLGLAGDYRANVNNALDQNFPNFLGDQTLFI